MKIIDRYKTIVGSKVINESKPHLAVIACNYKAMATPGCREVCMGACVISAIQIGQLLLNEKGEKRAERWSKYLGLFVAGYILVYGTAMFIRIFQ